MKFIWSYLEAHPSIHMVVEGEALTEPVRRAAMCPSSPQNHTPESGGGGGTTCNCVGSRGMHKSDKHAKGIRRYVSPDSRTVICYILPYSCFLKQF